MKKKTEVLCALQGVYGVQGSPFLYILMVSGGEVGMGRYKDNNRPSRVSLPQQGRACFQQNAAASLRRKKSTHHILFGSQFLAFVCRCRKELLHCIYNVWRQTVRDRPASLAPKILIASSPSAYLPPPPPLPFRIVCLDYRPAWFRGIRVVS